MGGSSPKPDTSELERQRQENERLKDDIKKKNRARLRNRKGARALLSFAGEQGVIDRRGAASKLGAS